jgi:pimeloyl-ACP methyl ester carboxylesterase
MGPYHFVRSLIVLLLASAVSYAAGTPPAPAFATANVYNAPIASEALHTDRSNLIVGVHGWTSAPIYWWLTSTDAWNNPGMKDTLATALGANSGQYDLWGLDWSQGAAAPGFADVAPSTANEINAQLQGEYLARVIADLSYQKVQFMGHSLGGRVVETASAILKQVRPGITLQNTFLDAYTPYNWFRIYGSNATYADSYYTNLDTNSGTLTANQYPSALNVNMNAFVTARPAEYTFGDESWRHNAPHRFYKDTAADPNNAAYAGYGFANSIAGGKPFPPNAASKAAGQNIVLAADGSTTAAPVTSVELRNPVSFPAAASALTGSENLALNEPSDTFTLSAFSAAGNQLGYGNFKIHLDQPVNFFEFNYNWGAIAAGTGRLTFYLRTPSSIPFTSDSNSLLWAMDSVNAFENTTLSTDRIIWTGTFSGLTTTAPLGAGDYTLAFRLDYLSGENVSIQISNIHAALLVPEPAILTLLFAASLALTFHRRSAKPVAPVFSDKFNP